MWSSIVLSFKSQGLQRSFPQFSQPASALDGNSAVTFVIPTEAYPDFLLRGTTNGRVCGFL
jgi:hypothetical protein